MIAAPTAVTPTRTALVRANGIARQRIPSPTAEMGAATNPRGTPNTSARSQGTHQAATLTEQRQNAAGQTPGQQVQPQAQLVTKNGCMRL
jgi:hypothetical protein